MIQLGLLRHGEVEGGSCFRGSTDDPLTDLGLNQMRAATHHGCWDRVISSPLQRCASFAEEFAEQYKLPLVFDERLVEMHFGTWEGRTAVDIMNETPDALRLFWNDPDAYPPPCAERLSEFQARVLSAWDSIISAGNDQRTLLVTHGGVIRILLCHLQQRPISELLTIEVDYGALFSLKLFDDPLILPVIELTQSD
ncbi:MAG: alpha-ribazole phosphatase family protein [Cycloclasticus sp.]|nr:alpha-ribazole phosphatase family protein [Cycloclasticus sp.]